MEWERWRQELMILAGLEIPRCYKPDNFGEVKKVELHHFSDASLVGYGQCSYLRMIDENNNVDTALVMAKSRVVPSKPITIPRLELTAAVTSVKISKFLRRELQYEDLTEVFWTDSMVVLGYIANDAKRFHIYVANRVQKIRDNTAVEQWRHIATDNNPADLTSRGANARELIDSQLWWKGPAFLSTLKPLSLCKIDNLGEGDPEIKKMTTLATGAVIEADIGLLPRLQRFSSWYKAKRAVAVCLRFKERLLNRTARFSTYKPVTAEEISQAEMLILKTVQAEAYSEEMPILRGIKAVDDNADQKGSTNRDSCRRRDLVLKKSSSLYRLDPYLDENDIIRVGGRIRRANVPRGVNPTCHPVSREGSKKNSRRLRPLGPTVRHLFRL
ncbi:uncharacterized protein LOC135488521 [Lineus longissimus]|uniref:uncharacterized protein LOC135488521 n=1 Tax=Lineus longissimus TaxID=88925 RepID=UPI00315DE6D6